MGAYRTPVDNVGAESGAGNFSEMKRENKGFKKGGMAKKGLMSAAAEGKRPRRATGGGVLSSAASGMPRGKASHY